MPFSNGYNFRRSVTLFSARVPSTQTDFPVAIAGTYPFLRLDTWGGGVTDSRGYDIIFTSDSAGMVVLDFERVFWDETTGRVEFHVKVPSVSASADTVFYLFYGNSLVTTDPANPTLVWDANYKAVYHMGTGAALILTDSTSNGNTGTNFGATPQFVQMGGAAAFVSGGAQYVDLGTGLNLTGPLTVEMRCFVNYLPPAGKFPIFLSNYDSGPTNGFELLIHDHTGLDDNSFYFQAENASAAVVVYSGTVPPDTPAHPANPNQKAVTYNTSSGFIIHYHDGINVGYGSGSTGGGNIGSSGIGTTTAHLLLGRRSGGSTDANLFLDGYIDELRISNIVRSADWIMTGYRNQQYLDIAGVDSFYKIEDTASGGSACLNAAY